MNIYEKGVEYLLSHTPGLSQERLNEYLTVKRCKNINKAFKKGVESIVDQSAQFMANTIGYVPKSKKENEPEDEQSKIIREIVCDFDIKSVYDTYSNDYERLCEEFYEKLGIDKEKRKSNDPWHRFSKNIIQLAGYLSKFKDIKDMYDYFDAEDKKGEDTRIQLAEKISKEVHLWSFTMACNWLKDIGMENFVKPDMHVVRIILLNYREDFKNDKNSIIYNDNRRNKNLYDALCEKESLEDVYKEINRLVGNEHVQKDVFKKAVLLAKECSVDQPEVTPFKLDRILYLVGSGNFFLEGDEDLNASQSRSVQFYKEFGKTDNQE